MSSALLLLPLVLPLLLKLPLFLLHGLLQSGVGQSGVTVAFTVLKMDAGAVLAQEVVDVDPNIKARPRSTTRSLPSLRRRRLRRFVPHLDCA